MTKQSLFSLFVYHLQFESDLLSFSGSTISEQSFLILPVITLDDITARLMCDWSVCFLFPADGGCSDILRCSMVKHPHPLHPPHCVLCSCLVTCWVWWSHWDKDLQETTSLRAACGPYLSDTESAISVIAVLMSPTLCYTAVRQVGGSGFRPCFLTTDDSGWTTTQTRNWS